MKHLIMILFAAMMINAVVSCSSGDQMNVQSIPSLISEDFVAEDTYEVVCRGFPKPGLTGTQKEESAKRAAVLNAYYFIKAKFDDTVQPDRDGTVVKYDVQDDFVIVKYRVQKSGLKKRVK